MTYLSAKKRRELLLPTAFALRIAWHLTTIEDTDQPREHIDPDWRLAVINAFGEALFEPLQGLAEAEQQKLLRAVANWRSWALEPYEGVDMGAAVVAVHEMIRLLTDASGYLELAPDSPFSRGWDRFTAYLQDSPDMAARLERWETLGRQIGLEILSRLQQRGVYRDLILPDAFDEEAAAA